MVSPVKKNNGSSPDIKFAFSAKKNIKGGIVKATKTQERPNAKPFTGKLIYLDLKSRRECNSLESSLRSLGAEIAVFLDRSVTHVVSDRITGNDARSPSTVVSPNASISPRIFNSPSTSERSPLPRSRGAAMLEKVSGLSNISYGDPISLALQWKLPVLSAPSVWHQISRHVHAQQPRSTPRKPAHTASTRTPAKSKCCFVKIECPENNYKPELLKVDAWPTFDLESSDGPFRWDAGAGQGVNPPANEGTMTRRPYKHSSNSEEDVTGVKSTALCNGNGHGPKRQLSDQDLKVQCNGLSSSLRSCKLLSPSGSDVLPLPSQRRSTRRTSASWCGSTRELSQLSPISPPSSPSELGVTLRPKGTLWLPVALIGTTAEEHGNSIRRRGGSDASLSSLDASKPRRKKLSPEEKLLQDNKEYFKMEVLHTKLRSSDIKQLSKRVSSRLMSDRCGKVASDADSVDIESLIGENKIMKLNGVTKPKRTRRSELMNLCDEAESFMFGESSRQSATSVNSAHCGGDSDDEDDNGIGSTMCSEERPRRKRRSHTEVFLNDNADYYKFETPDSRLRSQGSFSDSEKLAEPSLEQFPSTSSFSFEAVPDTEPWYPVFRRQDENNETLFPVISDPANQLFLLPYEMPRTGTAVPLRPDPPDYYAKRRVRLKHIISQSHPRKSPRCHASTLAILSSLKKRKRRSSGAPDTDSSPAKDDLLGVADLPDDWLNDVQMLDPIEANTSAPSSTPSRRKKTDERLAMGAASTISFVHQGNDVLDLVSSCLSTNDAHPTKRKGSKRRKIRVNKTGWVKTRVKKIQKGKGAPVNTGIEPENIVSSPRRQMTSPPAPPVSPCVVRVRKLSTTYCRKVLKRRRRRATTDQSWATRRR